MCQLLCCSRLACHGAVCGLVHGNDCVRLTLLRCSIDASMSDTISTRPCSIKRAQSKMNNAYMYIVSTGTLFTVLHPTNSIATGKGVEGEAMRELTNAASKSQSSSPYALVSMNRQYTRSRTVIMAKKQSTLVTAMRASGVPPKAVAVT